MLSEEQLHRSTESVMDFVCIEHYTMPMFGCCGMHPCPLSLPTGSNTSVLHTIINIATVAESQPVAWETQKADLLRADLLIWQVMRGRRGKKEFPNDWWKGCVAMVTTWSWWRLSVHLQVRVVGSWNAGFIRTWLENYPSLKGGVYDRHRVY